MKHVSDSSQAGPVCSVAPGARRAEEVRATAANWRLWAFCIALAAATLPGKTLVGNAQDGAGTALLLSVAGTITPATMDYVRRGIARAEEEGAGLVILEMDTPGGLMASTRELIKAILAARVPVVTYVAPSGSRAASAGTYILLASHVAAMAPATHLGSATPVQMGGLPGMAPDAPGDGDDESRATPPAADGVTAMERKVLEDAVSYIRELAARHNRNADWAERAVREAANLGAAQALEKNVIDLVAADIADLLAQLDGRTVQLAAGAVTLETGDLRIDRFEPDWRTRLLSVITDPNIAYFLLIIGFTASSSSLPIPAACSPA
jgi:membrane-bound serine protease (ClpP class)